MLTITGLNGKTLPLVDTSEPERYRDIDGTQTLTLTVRETELNSKAFQLIENEAILTLAGDKYVIKDIKSNVVDGTAQYEIQAIHKFFEDLASYWVYDIIEGRKVLSLHQALTHILPTGYTFTIYDEFENESFENFGNESAASLFEKIRVTFNFEYIKDGTHLKIYKQIGNKTSKQARYKHNIITIEGGLNSTNLATYIRGVGARDEETGEPLVEAEYTSPLAEIYGIKHAEPVEDERFYHEESLLEYIKSKLHDTIDISYTIEYDEFVKALDDDTDVELGDSIYLIHEVLKENFKTRVVAITDYPLSDTLKPIYTISSKRDSFIDKQIKTNIEKKNLEGKVKFIDEEQTEISKRIEKTIEAVNEVENTMKYVDEEMKRLENEVIPEIEQTVENVKIPQQPDPPFPIPSSNLWWDTSQNPPRLMRWNGEEWVVLAPEMEEIDELIEQMKQEALQEGFKYTDEEITAVRQAILNQVNNRLDDIDNQIDNLNDVKNELINRVDNADDRLNNIDNELSLKLNTIEYERDKTV